MLNFCSLVLTNKKSEFLLKVESFGLGKQKQLLNECYSINKQCICVVFCHQNTFLYHEKSFIPIEHKKIEPHFNLLAF